MTPAPTHRHARQNCPSCAKPLNAATSYKHDDAPRPGDLSVCAYCAAVLTFTPTTLRLATPAELDALRASEPETAAKLDEARGEKARRPFQK